MQWDPALLLTCSHFVEVPDALREIITHIHPSPCDVKGLLITPPARLLPAETTGLFPALALPSSVRQAAGH
ncbi:hypothetical protein CesoFtcFv8_004539 [Champsocephalus esox]|uniref:Uncharacterized protein n=2 Tax=Champsocephalus TaxID=52236 RepID=A0AAN8HW13_CHAGU|nr:hypothetical protein CesoFtcFv8_004539 [Champsocephalus esox]KAK5930158.1 hypothetical protein CgunFtcFv8_026419 [Champsocephalus gunnari]